MDALAPLNLQSCSTTVTINRPINSKDSKNMSKGCTTTNTESATVISNDNTLNEQRMYLANGSENGESHKELSTIIASTSNNGEHYENGSLTNHISSPNNQLMTNNGVNSASINFEVPSAANLLLSQKNSTNANEDNSPNSNRPDGNSNTANTMNYKNKASNASSSTTTNANSETKNSSTNLNASSIASNSSISIEEFLSNLNLSHLIRIFKKEEITFDILAEMGHEELKEIGVQAYGLRHKILKSVKNVQQKQTVSSTYPMFVDSNLINQTTDPHRYNIINNSQTTLIDLLPTDAEFELVEDEMQTSIREHKDSHAGGGKFSR